MASEAKTESGTDGSGKADQEVNKGKGNADQGANKGKDNEHEADKGKDGNTSQDAKGSTENTAEPAAETADESGKKSPENTKSRAPSATQKTPQIVNNSRPTSSVGKKSNTDEEATKPSDTNPSDPPPRGGTPGGRKTADGEKPSTPAPDTPRDGKNSEQMSPGLATPRSIVSPPLTAMTMNVSRGGPCDICPQMGENKTTKAEFVCHGCVQRFCVRCAKRHLDTAVFANHEVDPMASDDQVKALQELSCRVHPQRTLEFFCQGCQEAACGMCISFNHGGKQHQIGRVENLASNRHVLLSRYEQLIRGELSPSKQAATPDRARPVPFLLWKRESVLRDGAQEEGAEHLCGPSDITFLPGGQLIIADRWNQSVKYFDEDGGNAMVVLEKLAPLRVCCTASGRIAVVDDFAQGQIKLIRSEQFIKKTQEPSSMVDSESETSNNNRDTVDSKSDSADKGTTADNAHNVEGVQEGNSEQNKDVQESDKENKDTAKARNTSRQSDRASLASKQSTRSQGRRTADQDIFRDLSIITNSIDPQDTWKPKDMKRPWAVAVNKYGQWLVSEYEQYVRSSVTIYDSDGSRVRSFGGYGDRDDQFEWPAYLASDSRGRIVVSDYYNHTVKIFDQRGNFISKLGKGWGKKDGHLTFPKGVCVDSDDHILVVDSGNNRVCEFAPDGAFVRNLLTNADGLVEPEGIAFVELPEDSREEEQGDDSGVTAQGTSNSQKLEGAQRDAEQRANNQTEGSSGGPQRRLAVTLCKGHEYSALLVYGLEQAES